MANNTLAAKPLFAEQLPLVGSHLIEASAGTGKTFNITRIYLRMLLERKIAVENILVMTFTKAATEEIRGRIDQFLRETLADWQQLTATNTDPFFYQLGQKVSFQDAKVLIKNALLNLDEAAIFTIHGFCKRVLSQQAFTSGMSFNAQMEADDAEIVLEAVQDFYRVIAKEYSLENYQLITESWPTPESFLLSFRDLIYQEEPAETQSKSALDTDIIQLAEASEKSLLTNEVSIFAELVDNKTGKAKATRLAEYEQLLEFVKSVAAQTDFEINSIVANMPDFKFISKARLPKSAAKAEIKAHLVNAFGVLEQLKKQLNNYQKNVQNAETYQLIIGAVAVIKANINQKKRQVNILNFDDLITHLAKALDDEKGQGLAKAPLTQALLKQYPIALVDEFQDTDPKQFAILEQLYFANHKTDDKTDNASDSEASAVYLIGDPKQAIYGFRGGDIFTYLQASEQVEHIWVMDTNWRSSANMISGYNHLFYGNELEQEAKDVFGYNIAYLPVNPSPNAQKSSFIDPEDYKALQFIEFIAPDEFVGRGSVIKTEFRPYVANWCANEISRLLAQTAISTQSAEEESKAPLQAADIAILVRDGREAEYVKHALDALNIASVYKSQRSNLFLSAIAKEFIHVLNAIINQEDDRAFIAALSGPYFAKAPNELFKIQQDESYWEQIRFNFNQLKGIWYKRGFMAMGLKLLHDHYPKKSKDNERQLTNIIHLFELLQKASQRLKQPQELMAYLQEQCLNPAQSEAELRLESDANLVQIVTLHGSKGLEYPVVFIPYASRHKNPVKFGTQTKKVLRYHDDNNKPAIFLGDNDNAKNAMAKEGYAEDVRLLYVGITRAKFRCYLGCTGFSEHHESPLGKCLSVPKEGTYQDALQTIITASPSSIGHEFSSEIELNTQYQVTDSVNTDHTAAQFNGKIERDWWLSSFSALTRNIRHAGKTEPDRDTEQDASINPDKEQIRFAFVKGARTGNMLHDIFERIDFTQPNWKGIAYHYLTKFGDLPKGFVEQDVYDWLDECLHAHLNDQGLSLAQIPVDNTLREAQFYFPMENVKVNALEQCLNQFRASLSDSFNLDISLHVANIPVFGELKGMMHGFIDLIFEADGKYYLADYKSSHLGNHIADYNPGNLAQHISDNYYDLQFLIYSLALHRYLQRRIPDYLPEKNFGGVYYFYLRGMTAKTSEQDNNLSGVFFTKLKAELLNNLDLIFSNGSAQAESCVNATSNQGVDHE